MKELSGRKFILMTIISTYCIILVGLMVAMLKKVIEPTVFLGTLVGFAALASQICDWYFRREDREKPKEGV